MKNLSHFPQTDIRFWQSAVFRQLHIVDGQRRLTKEWYARVKFQGKRAFFPLDTPNRAAAAAKARDIFRFEENAIRVEPTQFFHPNPQDSIAEVQVEPEGLSVEAPGDGTELEISEDPVIQQLFDELGRALIAYWHEYPNWIREPPAFL